MFPKNPRTFRENFFTRPKIPTPQAARVDSPSSNRYFPPRLSFALMPTRTFLLSQASHPAAMKASGDNGFFGRGHSPAPEVRHVYSNVGKSSF